MLYRLCHSEGDTSHEHQEPDMARRESTIGSSRKSAALRAQIAEQAAQRNGYRPVADGFICLGCEHHEVAPRDERIDLPFGSDEWEAAYDAQVEARRAAAARIVQHVADERIAAGLLA